ncbi:MAG: alpha/beta fold hydrolase [Gammaproteobacteria bacterium]|nr:alpha/beta fold hydrolase [Gammaproteobacteria bacterium]
MISEGADPAGAVAAFCHPHPQYGGSMHDAVIDTAVSALAPNLRASLKFNFRGVGASEGEFDGGNGEVDDVAAAAAHLAQGYPEIPIWLVGYSFGAAMAWRARLRFPCERIILIAPPLGRLPFDGSSTPSTRIVVIAGTADEFVDAAALDAWAQTQAAVEVHTIEHCDHFFSGNHAALAHILRAL